MIIFVDDLDRCPPTKVADLIEVINIILGLDFVAKKIMFVIGLDPEMVAAALENAYTKVISKLPSYSNTCKMYHILKDLLFMIQVVFFIHIA